MVDENKNTCLSCQSAYPLAHVAKTTTQFDSLTPRWITKLFEWKPISTGIFRLNKVKEGKTPLDILCSNDVHTEIPEAFIDYVQHPREYILNSISSIIKISTRVSDLYSSPYNQITEQLRLAVESIQERQESQIINNEDYGLLNNIVDSQRIKSKSGFPTPDDFDTLISKVWKEPSYFLAHPTAIAAFGRECTRCGVPPATVTIMGSPFLTWRGIPIVPTDKLFVDGQKCPNATCGKTNILLVRTGEKKKGVIGLYQSGVPGEHSRGLSIRFMGIDNQGIGSYLISIYCSASILTDDAIAVLENVDIGNYYEYK